VEPFEVKLFYTKNEYLRFLDYLEGDDSLPDDLYDSLIDGIREQVGEHQVVDDLPIGTVATMSTGVQWVKFSEDQEKNWVADPSGVHASGRHVLEAAVFVQEPGA